MQKSPLASIIPIVIIVLIACGISIGGSQNSSVYQSIPIFALCGFIAFAVNWLVFIPSSMGQTEKIMISPEVLPIYP